MRTYSLLAILVVCPSAFAQKPEPKYEGKPLAYWMDRFQKAGDRAWSWKDRENAEQERAHIERIIMTFGADAAPAIPALLTMLDDLSHEYRRRAANILSAIGPAAKSALPVLIKMLEEKNPRDPNQVIRVLCAIGPDAKSAIPAIRVIIIPYFSSPIDKDRYDLAFFGSEGIHLHELGPAVVPLLLEIMQAEYGSYIAGRELGKLGPKAKEALPQLVKLLKQEKNQRRINVAYALWKIDKNSEAIPLLLASLKNKDIDISRRAAIALGEIGPDAKEAVPILKELLPKEPELLPVSGPDLEKRDQYYRDVREAINQIERKFNQ